MTELIKQGEADAATVIDSGPVISLFMEDHPDVGASKENHPMRGMTCLENKRYYNADKDKAYRKYCGFE